MEKGLKALEGALERAEKQLDIYDDSSENDGSFGEWDDWDNGSFDNNEGR